MGLLFSRMFSSLPGNKDAGIPVLGLDNAGKSPFSDLPGVFDAAAVTEALELHRIKSRQWAIFKACAAKGEGLGLVEYHSQIRRWLALFKQVPERA